MTDDHFDGDDYLYEDDCTCPRCSGSGWIDCYCGGDLCVCDNYGEKPCPLCLGDGQISQTIYDWYQAKQRQMWLDYREAMMRRQPSPKPQTTAKRAKVKAARKQRHRCQT